MDFLVVDNILSNSPNNDLDEFYTEEDNFMFKREEIIDPFWEIIMAHKREKVNERLMKFELSRDDEQSFQDDHHSLVVIRGVLFLLGCYIILLLKRK
jgi:hypothetical protein